MKKNNEQVLLLKNDEVFAVLKCFGDDVNYYAINIDSPRQGFTTVVFDIDTKKHSRSKKIQSISNSMNSTNLVDFYNACV